MRDLVLAQEYRDGEIIFASQNLKGNINNRILKAGYGLEILEGNSRAEFQKILDRYNPNTLIIDNYSIDFRYERELKVENPNLKLMVLDDTYERHYCDILLNHNIYADAERYRGLVPDWCEVRCGGEYTLIRDEFYREKNRKTIYVAIGGTDHTNINIDILEVLKGFSNLDVILVTTTANQNLEKLEEYIEDKAWIELHINSNRVAKLMKMSELAIITPSVTLHEVIFMDLPFIAIKTADNQKYAYSYLVEHGYLALKHMDRGKLREALYAIGVN
jgi:UDP-2,4-diacetamido-2,4,6-trideoxy-beta-L-altropyranose hydrolase